MLSTAVQKNASSAWNWTRDVSGYINIATKKISFNTIFPLGFPKFLAQCADRPCNFEELCNELWIFERKWKMYEWWPRPVWMNSIETLRLARKPEAMMHWWWGGVVAAASSAVQRLLDIQQRSVSVGRWVTMVPGLPTYIAKALNLPPFHTFLMLKSLACA